MTVTIYHNPRCSKSRETLKLLESKGMAPRVVEYLKTPPRQAEIKRILAKLDLPAQGIIRPKEAKEAGVDVTSDSQAALIKAIATHPAILQRPTVVTGKNGAMGRPPEAVLGIPPLR